jgi:hypothetical protein
MRSPVLRVTIILVVLALAALIAGLLSCGGGKRDVSTLEKALLGHWVTTERGTRAHYYFGDGTLVLGVPGRSAHLTYDVVYSDDKANKVVIEIRMELTDSPMPFSVGMEKELVFSKNRKSITETSEVNGVKFTNKWKYVDSKTEP